MIRDPRTTKWSDQASDQVIRVRQSGLWIPEGEKSEIDLVGDIPSGLMAPKLISMDRWGKMIQDAIPLVKLQFNKLQFTSFLALYYQSGSKTFDYDSKTP